MYSCYHLLAYVYLDTLENLLCCISFPEIVRGGYVIMTRFVTQAVTQIIKGASAGILKTNTIDAASPSWVSHSTWERQ